MSAPKSSSAFSIASVLSLICAIGSLFVGTFPAILLAVLAILLGSFGAMLSLSPHRRGGIVSAFAMIIGVIGIVLALVKAVFLWLV